MWRSTDHPLSALVLGYVAVLCNSALLLAQDAPKRPQVLQVSLAKIEPGEQDNDEERLLKERYNAALDEWKALVELFHAGQITPADAELQAAMRRTVSAGLELHRSPVDRIKLLEQYVNFSKEVDLATAAAAESGRASSQERHRARYHRLDAELQLLRETKRIN